MTVGSGKDMDLNPLAVPREKGLDLLGSQAERCLLQTLTRATIDFVAFAGSAPRVCVRLERLREIFYQPHTIKMMPQKDARALKPLLVQYLIRLAWTPTPMCPIFMRSTDAAVANWDEAYGLSGKRAV